MSDLQEVYVVGHRELEYTPYQFRKSGYVAPADFHKIGIAGDPEKRLGMMNSGTPHKLELMTTIQADDAREVERQLHRLFNMAHHRGEWYKLPYGAVNSLKGIDRINSEILKEYVDEKVGPVFDTSLYVELMEWRAKYE